MWIGEHIEHEECGSSDALALYEQDDGRITGYCFSCNTYVENPLEEERIKVKEDLSKWEPLSFNKIKELPDRPLTERGISKEVAKFYGVKVQLDDQGNDLIYYFPYRKGGRVTGYKLRRVGVTDKKNRYDAIGDIKGCDLFGQHKCGNSGQLIIVTEGECFPGDAEVLTPTGWVRFDEYSGEEVLQYNEGLGEFTKPNYIIQKEGNFELITNETKGWVSETTKNHSLITLDYRGRVRKTTASNFPTSSADKIPRTVIYEGNGIPLSDNEIALCIAISADFKIDNRKNGTRYAHANFKKDRKKERIKEILDECGIEYTTYQQTREDYVSFNITLPEWVPGRFFPNEWITLSTQKQSQFILNELIYWDGNFVKNRTQTEYNSKYLHNAEWVQTLCHVSGIVSSIFKRSNKWGTWYKVSLLNNKVDTSCQNIRQYEGRTVDKVYCVSVNSGAILVKQQGKITVTGNCDALAAFQMIKELKGKSYRAVSLPNGAGSIKKHLDYLENFDQVKLCLDTDSAGIEAANKAANLFSPGKSAIMELPNEMDVNDMLLAGKHQEFYTAINNAKSIHLDGIVSGGSTWDYIKNKPEVKSIPYPEGWDLMNEKTYGIRLGELDTWTSGSGSGKTQVLRQLQKHLLDNTQENIGVLALEEPLVDTVEALMGLHLRKRIHLPDVRETINEDDLYQAWLATAGTDRIHFYDHFGSLDDESLIAKIRYMARALDCKYIFLDHLSIVISEFAADGGERERIDTAMSRLKKLTQELGIWIGLVVHLRKVSNNGPSFEEGAIPTLDDLRGSGSIKQLSNGVYAIARNQQDPNDKIRNTSSLHVLKSRFTGDTGIADWLYFDRDTGLMVPTDNPHISKDEDE